jgi:hypothetical protein
LEGPAVCVPLISSTGHGDAALHRVHYQEGKFALANLLVALLPRNPEKLSTKYLYHLLMTRKNELLVPLMLGTANVSLKEQDIAGVEIPLPSLAEQVRIVERIEELVAQIDEARTLRHQAAEEADALVLSALKHLRLPTGTVGKPVSACSSMSTGTTPPSARSDYYGGPIQWYTPGDLEYQQRLEASSRTLSELALAERKARMFEPGTVLLLVIGGSLGKVGLAHERCSANHRHQVLGRSFA